MIPPLSDEYINYFMKLCVALAHDAIPQQEVPVSCIYVHYPSSSIVGSSFNQTVVKHNALRHCEVECLSQLEHKVRHAIAAYLEASVDNVDSATINSTSNSHQPFAQSNTLITSSTSTPSTTPSSPTAPPIIGSTTIPTTTLNSPTSYELFLPYIHQQRLDRSQLHDLQTQPLPLKHRSAFTRLMKSVCEDIIVFVSVEPCIMCTGVLHNAGISTVYSGCGNDKFGGCGSVASCHYGYDLDNPLSRASVAVPSSSINTTTSSHPRHDSPSQQQLHQSPPPVTAPSPHLIELYTDLTKLPNTPQCPRNYEDPTISNIKTHAPNKDLQLEIRIQYHEGYLREECISALQLFYFRGNPNAPADKRQRPLVQAQLDRLAAMGKTSAE